MFGNYYMPMNGYQGYGMGNAAPDQLAYLRAGQQNQSQMQPMQQMQAPQMQSNAPRSVISSAQISTAITEAVYRILLRQWLLPAEQRSTAMRSISATA